MTRCTKGTIPTIIIYYIVVVEMIQEMSSEIFQTYVSKIKDQNNLVTDSYLIVRASICHYDFKECAHSYFTLIILFLDHEFL